MDPCSPRKMADGSLGTYVEVNQLQFTSSRESQSQSPDQDPSSDTDHFSISDAGQTYTDDLTEDQLNAAIVDNPTFIYNSKSGVLHWVTEAPYGLDERHTISNKGARWCTSCRCELVKSTLSLVHEMPDDSTLCKRKACQHYYTNCFSNAQIKLGNPSRRDGPTLVMIQDMSNRICMPAYPR